jgi:phosphoketolase
MDAYWSAANYLSVGQIYLKDNPLLERPLTWKSTTLRAPPPSGERMGNTTRSYLTH